MLVELRSDLLEAERLFGTTWPLEATAYADDQDAEHRPGNARQ
ncbi:hypothetical protein [Micromonospora sp. NPDC048169]